MTKSPVAAPLQEMKTLVIPVEPIAGEGPSDMLLRAAAINGFVRPARLLELVCNPSLAPRFSSRSIPRLRIDPDSICALVGARLGDENVLKLFPACRTESKRGYVSILGAEVRATDLLTRRRLSPRSLMCSEHQNALWSLRLFDFDIGTRERLIDTCPVCNETFGFKYTWGIAFCEHCGQRGVKTDLRDYPQPLADVTDSEAISFVASLIDPSAVTRSSCVLHASLRNFDRGELFRFSSLIAKLIARGRRPQEYVKRRYIVPAPIDIEQAGRAILSWPEGVQRLAAYLSRDTENTQAAIGRCPEACSPFDVRLHNPAVPHLMARLLREAQRLPTSAVAAKEQSGVPRQSTLLREVVDRPNSAEKQLGRLTGVPTPFMAAILSSLYDLPRAMGLAKETDAGKQFQSLETVLGGEGRGATLVPALSLIELVAAVCPPRVNPWPVIFRLLSRSQIPFRLLGRSAGSLTRRIIVDLPTGKTLRGVMDGESAVADKSTSLSTADAANFLGVNARYLDALRRAKLLPAKIDFETISKFKEFHVLKPHVVTLAKLNSILTPGKILNHISSLGVNPIISESVLVWRRGEIESVLKG